ncbi:MAG: class I SAM-dependent methyltransferase [Xanthomonadales bacterium]|nr:class I SAM-dependent methyltransferase [Xanthomonadales bacterium]
MFAVSQIIERNLHRRRTAGSTLWVNPEQDDCWQTVNAHCTSLKLFSQNYGSYAFLKSTGANIEFSDFPQTDKQKYDWIIVNLPRQKALLTMMLDCAAALLAKDGVLWLVGENKAGIKSADRHLKLHFGQIRKLDNARHCSLYEADTRLNQKPFKPLTYRQQWPLSCAGPDITVLSYPGVFAHGRLDDGTSLLLEALASIELSGDVLDFACGAGLIGACIAARNPDTCITLLDANALALRACKETLEANHLDGSVLASDGLSEVKGRYDLVVSNPPIHAGVKTDNRLGMRLLDSVQEHIRPGGALMMVANVHLPYEKWLAKRFKRFSELNANENYKVIIAKK